MTVRVLPTQATTPPFAPGTFKNPPLEQWLQSLLSALRDDRRLVGDRIEWRILYGPTSDFPAATGSANLYYDTTVGDLYIDTGTWDLVFSTVIPHTHDDRYYTETEVDTLLSGKANTSHTHTESQITDLNHTDTNAFHKTTANEFGSVSLATPDTSDRIIFEDASASYAKKYNTIANLPFAASSHTHDDRYYTETEVNNLLTGYLPLTAGSSKPLTGSLYFNYGYGVVVKESGGTARAGLGIDSSANIVVGDPANNLMLRCDQMVFLSGGYLWTNGEKIETGGGDIITGSTSGGNVDLGTGGALRCRNSSGTWINMAWLSSNLRVLGDTTGDTWVEGSPLKLYTYGYSGSSVPNTTTWPTAGSWGIHIDDGVVYLVYRNGATVVGVELTASPFHLA